MPVGVPEHANHVGRATIAFDVELGSSLFRSSYEYMTRILQSSSIGTDFHQHLPRGKLLTAYKGKVLIEQRVDHLTGTKV